jgi:hypothetical protein
MRRSLLALLGLLTLLGVAITFWANVGDASVVAATAGVHQTLQNHGQGDNVQLRSELSADVLRLQWLWTVVQWLGLAVMVLGGAGFALVWRGS